MTYQKVFSQLQILKTPTRGNRVIFACNCDDFSDFPLASEQLISQTNRYQFDIKQLTQLISNKVTWDITSRLLTDEYSPVNLLKAL